MELNCQKVIFADSSCSTGMRREIRMYLKHARMNWLGPSNPPTRNYRKRQQVRVLRTPRLADRESAGSKSLLIHLRQFGNRVIPAGSGPSSQPHYNRFLSL